MRHNTIIYIIIIIQSGFHLLTWNLYYDYSNESVVNKLINLVDLVSNIEMV